MVNQQLLVFFSPTLKLDPTNYFPFNTAEVQPIYLKLTVVFS